MAYSYPSDGIFSSNLKNHYGLFFLHTLPLKIVFKLPYGLLYQHITEISTFYVKT